MALFLQRNNISAN